MRLAEALVAISLIAASNPAVASPEAGEWFGRMTDKDFETMESVCLMAVEQKAKGNNDFLKEFLELEPIPDGLKEVYYRFCIAYAQGYTKAIEEAARRLQSNALCERERGEPTPQ